MWRQNQSRIVREGEKQMKKVIDTEKLPIKLWLDDIEDGAIVQAKNLANLPFVFKWISIMPDSHQGYGMPIGGVMATRGVVVPNAVGVDIGCGMCAVPTSLQSCDVETLKIIMGKIRESVPVGFNHLKEKAEWEDGNEYPIIKLDISHTSHPFYTGKQQLVDTAGRIDKFKTKYQKHLKK